MTKEGMVIAVPQEKPDEKKPIANAHFVLMGSHTPLDKEIGKTQIRQFHFRRQALKKHPDKNPGKEKEAAEEFKKLKAAMEVIDFIYADEKNYGDAEQLKFIRVLVDEPEYAEQILRNKASKDRCDLIVLENALE